MVTWTGIPDNGRYSRSYYKYTTYVYVDDEINVIDFEMEIYILHLRINYIINYSNCNFTFESKIIPTFCGSASYIIVRASGMIKEHLSLNNSAMSQQGRSEDRLMVDCV